MKKSPMLDERSGFFEVYGGAALLQYHFATSQSTSIAALPLAGHAGSLTVFAAIRRARKQLARQIAEPDDAGILFEPPAPVQRHREIAQGEIQRLDIREFAVAVELAHGGV